MGSGRKEEGRVAPPVALTIAGSDSGGGAGIQADLKVFAHHGVHGLSVVTALTAQNSQGVSGVWTPPADFVFDQMRAVMTDFNVGAAKTGMLANASIIERVAEALDEWPIENLVVDPVMVATSGDALLEPDAVESYKRLLFPRAMLVTPNLAEARALTGIEVIDESSGRAAAEAILQFGPKAVLIKGGHGKDSSRCDDWFSEGTNWEVIEGPRIETRNTHGTGCFLSAAIAARLARGEELIDAIRSAKDTLTNALTKSYQAGEGPGIPSLLS